MEFGQVRPGATLLGALATWATTPPLHRTPHPPAAGAGDQRDRSMTPITSSRSPVRCATVTSGPPASQIGSDRVACWTSSEGAAR